VPKRARGFSYIVIKFTPTFQALPVLPVLVAAEVS
jgi:hypothetical protein